MCRYIVYVCMSGKYSIYTFGKSILFMAKELSYSLKYVRIPVTKRPSIGTKTGVVTMEVSSFQRVLCYVEASKE